MGDSVRLQATVLSSRRRPICSRLVSSLSHILTAGTRALAHGSIHRLRCSPGVVSHFQRLLSRAGFAAAAVFLLPQRLDPAGAGAAAETGKGQRTEPHVLAGSDELSKTFLVGEGVAGASRTRPPHAAHATVLGFLLLANQLGVADLGKKAERADVNASG